MKRTVSSLIFLVLCFLCLDVVAQAQIEAGKYFYSKQSTAANFGEQAKYVMDSVLIFYEKSHDTLTYWTLSQSTPLSKKEIAKKYKNAEFGRQLQKGLILNDGRVTIHKLRPRKYLLRNDSLFEWSDKARYFSYIFSPKLFSKNLQIVIDDNVTTCPNTITLLYKWQIETTAYYRIEISNDCDSGHRWGYVLNDRFEFVTFGAWSTKEARALTRANMVVDNVSGK